MKMNSIVPVICAFVAAGIAACSGESQPTAPSENGGTMNRVMYAGATSETDPSDGSTLTPEPVPPGPASENPAPGSGGGRAAGGGGTGAGGTGSGAPAIMRPIQEFLQEQGTYCVDNGYGGCQLYALPVSNYLTWFDRSQNVTMAIDYAGIVNSWAQDRGFASNAQIAGSVTEQPMADGRSRYTVELKGSGISSYAVQGTNLGAPITFGVRPREMGDPMAKAAAGDLRMVITFIQSPGKLPDLVQLLRSPRDDQKVLSITLDYSAQGLLRDPASPEMAGKDGTVSVRFDGSQGPVMSSNPFDPAMTAPTGYADMSFTTYSTE